MMCQGSSFYNVTAEWSVLEKEMNNCQVQYGCWGWSGWMNLGRWWGLSEEGRMLKESESERLSESVVEWRETEDHQRGAWSWIRSTWWDVRALQHLCERTRVGRAGQMCIRRHPEEDGLWYQLQKLQGRLFIGLHLTQCKQSRQIFRWKFLFIWHLMRRLKLIAHRIQCITKLNCQCHH